LIFLARDFGAKFYEPDALHGTYQQNTLGFTFSASTVTLERETDITSNSIAIVSCCSTSSSFGLNDINNQNYFVAVDANVIN